MKETIKLFKAVPITEKRKSRKQIKEINEITIPKGFVFAPEVIYNYNVEELKNLILDIENEYGITGEQLNASFHKSWDKVKNASDRQLILEQIIHYVTTYGFEALGIYNENSVYIPPEKLDIPNLKIDKIPIVVIKGYTNNELKTKVLDILKSGIALKEETIDDIIVLCDFLHINKSNLNEILNKEVKIILYTKHNIIPQDNIDFLRCIIYSTTGKTLLIKNPATVEIIKQNSMNVYVVKMFKDYSKKYGYKELAKIFYRFKPLFLALKCIKQMKPIINKIRRLANKYHKPMVKDYINSVTENLNNGERIEIKDFEKELAKVNIFRKIRLAYALKYRSMDFNSIMFKIRNGKAYAKEYHFKHKNKARTLYNITLKSISECIKKNVKGKKVYIPENVRYALPATEKQFTENIPVGTCVHVLNHMIFGVHWKNLPKKRVDLDLSLMGIGSKIGWDSHYRNEERTILFSGDVTDAPGNGASELFYVQKQANSHHLMMLNYFNYDEKKPAPFKIILARKENAKLNNNYTVDPNDLIISAKSIISTKQKTIGLINVTTRGTEFYFVETSLGNRISSGSADYVEHAINYIKNFHKNTINLNSILEKSECKFVDNKEKCDIDLSLENLEKDTILNLLK